MVIIVAIPAYNEENTISDIIMRSKKYSDFVIVCDDGSKDSTADVAGKAGAIVVKHEKNKGKGAALRTLFNKSIEINADVMVTIDGDGQFLPEEIPVLTDPILQHEADIVVGNRFENSAEMPKYRKIGVKFFDKLTNLATEIPISDTQSGFRAYSRKAISEIKFDVNGFAADSEILIDATKKKLGIIERNVKVLYDTGFKTSTKDPMTHSSDLLASLIEIIALRHPLKTLGLPGLILIIIGGIFTGIVISYFDQTRQFSIPGTLIAVGSFSVGTILLLMSVVLYSISRILNKKNT